MDFDSWFRVVLGYRNHTFLNMAISEKMAAVADLSRGEPLLNQYLRNEELQREAKMALSALKLFRDEVEDNDGREARSHIKELITQCARIKASINIMRRRENGETQEPKTPKS